MLRNRRIVTLLLALALATVTGCSGSGTGTGASTDPSDSAAQTSTTGSSAEETGSSSEEESSEAEKPAEGGPGAVSVELAGLPVGGGGAVDLGTTWCEVLFWGGELPAGVVLEIDAVQVGASGGTVEPAGCEDAPPCVGSKIPPDDPCAVVVTPPSPDATEVSVRLDGTLRCPDQATCDAVGITGGGFFPITDPSPGGGTEGETGTEGGTGTDSGTGAVDDAAGGS